MPRILYIDDDPVITKVAEVNFKVRGIEAVVATSGEQALQFITTDHNFDCIVIDLMLTGISGLQVLQKLKYEPTTRDIPCIMVTSIVGDTTIEESKRLGAFECLFKDHYIGMALVDKVMELVPSLRPQVATNNE